MAFRGTCFGHYHSAFVKYHLESGASSRPGIAPQQWPDAGISGDIAGMRDKGERLLGWRSCLNFFIDSKGEYSCLLAPFFLLF
jgi:hypothetical protein